MSEPITPAAETYAQWRQRVADAYLGAFAGEDQGRTARSHLSRLGMTAKVTSDATGLAVALKEEDLLVPVPYGTKREQFTAGALAEFEAEALRSSKRDVWHEISNRARNGYLEIEQAIALLDVLGYNAEDRPQEITTVSIRVDTGKTNSYGERVSERHAFTLPGKVTKEEVIAKLVEIFPEAGGAATKLLSAFPQAKGLPEPFANGNVSVSTTQQWPASCEFDDENA